MNGDKFQAYHREVVAALTTLGDPARGRAVQRDRGSQLIHLGVTFPILRRRVKQGFSFYHLPEERVLEIWDVLWRTSPYGDVLFAAIEYYTPVVRNKPSYHLWPIVREWSDRVDNWCHSDGLSAIYSRIIETHLDETYPQIEAWNLDDNEWLRRISLVSLIHYSGKNAVFLPVNKILPLVSNCIDDPRYYVQTAVGWVLRELGRVHPNEIQEFLKTHCDRMDSRAFSRAIERLSPGERTQLRHMRKSQLRARAVE